ncbi:unnamed protein product, partial [Ilex paraguariensis]
DTHYEFVKVHKLNLQIVAGFMFYITFEATVVAPADGCSLFQNGGQRSQFL